MSQEIDRSILKRIYEIVEAGLAEVLLLGFLFPYRAKIYLDSKSIIELRFALRTTLCTRRSFLIGLDPAAPGHMRAYADLVSKTSVKCGRSPTHKFN